MLRFDKGEVRGKVTRSDEGYMRASAIVTRTGVFLYKNADGTTRRELRHPDDVFSADSMASLKMIPLTNGHPAEQLVNSDNVKELSIGTTGESVEVDGKHLITTLSITHKDGVDSVDLGRKELSLGYNLTLDEEQGEYNGERYDCRQRNIRYNHLAIVDRARAGGAASLNLDAGDALQIDATKLNKPKKEQKTMDKISLDGIPYEAAPEVINALNKANARADEAETKVSETEAKLDAANEEKSKLEAERDSLKEENKKATNSDAIQEKVAERIKLEKIAEKALNADDAKEISNLDEAEIKKKVILAKSPEANLDGKDDAYIEARFDMACELIEAEKPFSKQRADMEDPKPGADETKDVKQAQDSAMDAMKNMHKINNKKGEK